MIVRLRYLLDANVISEMMRPAPAMAVADCLDRIADNGLAVASITVWEILSGIGQLPAGRRRDEVAACFKNVLADVFEDAVLEWTAADAAACASIMEEKRRRGEPLDAHLPDAFVAGLARNRKLVIVTRNEREFRNTGLEILNPWSPAAG